MVETCALEVVIQDQGIFLSLFSQFSNPFIVLHSSPEAPRLGEFESKLGLEEAVPSLDVLLGSLLPDLTRDIGTFCKLGQIT